MKPYDSTSTVCNTALVSYLAACLPAGYGGPPSYVCSGGWLMLIGARPVMTEAVAYDLTSAHEGRAQSDMGGMV